MRIPQFQAHFLFSPDIQALPVDRLLQTCTRNGMDEMLLIHTRIFKAATCGGAAAHKGTNTAYGGRKALLEEMDNSAS